MLGQPIDLWEPDDGSGCEGEAKESVYEAISGGSDGGYEGGTALDQAEQGGVGGEHGDARDHGGNLNHGSFFSTKNPIYFMFS